MILVRGWQIQDMIIVSAHVLCILLLGMPLLAMLLLERVEYSPFSLIPEQFIITREDIVSNIWILPDKLLYEESWVKSTVGIVLVFWALGFLDLLVYYFFLSFP